MLWPSFLSGKCSTSLAACAVIVTIVSAAHASAQRVSFGVVAGGYANSDFDSHYLPFPGFNPDIVQSDSAGYIFGPSFDVRLLPQLSVGVEALYKPLHYRAAASFQNGVAVGFAPATVVTWQFPLLAKYTFSLGRLKPFFEGGPSFRTTGNLNSADPSHFGLTAGLGTETEWRRLRMAPTLRYTRWAEDPLSANVRTRADQLEFLVGFHFAMPSDAYPLGRRVSLGAALAQNLAGDFRTTRETMFDPFTGESFIFQNSSVRSVVVSPVIEFSLSTRLSIEGNAITRPFRRTSRILNPEGTSNPGPLFNRSLRSGPRGNSRYC